MKSGRDDEQKTDCKAILLCEIREKMTRIKNFLKARIIAKRRVVKQKYFSWHMATVVMALLTLIAEIDVGCSWHIGQTVLTAATDVLRWIYSVVCQILMMGLIIVGIIWCALLWVVIRNIAENIIES
jgi:hypothetical protein